MKYIFLIICSTILILLAGCKQPENTKPSSLKKDVLAQVKQFIEETGIPAISVVITKNDSLIFNETMGYSNLQQKAKPTPKTVFSVGSCVKPIMATAILQLVEKNLVDLDTPVNQYLKTPNAELEKFEKPITLRHLLSHQSGIGVSANFFPLWQKNESRSLRQIVAEISPQLPPETQYQYANEAFVIVALVIEDITGIKFEDYIQKNILSVLEISEIDLFHPNEKQVEKMALPYKLVYNQPLAIAQEFSEPYPGGGMSYLSAEDYSKFVITLANLGEFKGQRLLGEGFVKQFNKTAFNHEFYGLGMASETNEQGDTLIFHSGLQNGYTANFKLNTQSKIGVVVLANAASEIPVSELAYWVLKRASSKEIINPLPSFKHPTYKEISISKEEQEKLIGIYTIENTNAHIKIQLKNHQLFLINPLQQEFAISPYSKHKFFLKEEEEFVEFNKTDSANTYFIFKSNHSEFKAIRTSKELF